MATTTINANNKLIKFRKDIAREYIRGNLFAPYTGEAPGSIFRIINDLKSGGEQVNIPLSSRLRQKAIGTGPMVGNEEVIDNAGFRVWIDWARNAVKTNKAELQKSSVDIFELGRPLLEDWGKELIRDETIDALFALPSTAQPAGLGTTNGQRINGVIFDAATVAQRNQWITDNADRVLIGGQQGNLATGNFAASMAAVTPAMTFSCAMINKMKRLAKKASPRIRPYMVKDANREYFVVFCGSNAFRDLQNDPTMITVNSQARPREGNGVDKNPIFQDGDLLYNGVIIREIPEIDIRAPSFYATAGNGGTTVSPVWMLGANAVAQAWGQMPRPTRLNEDDYDFLDGIGIDMALGIGKIAKATPGGALREWGTFTGFVASQPDT